MTALKYVGNCFISLSLGAGAYWILNVKLIIEQRLRNSNASCVYRPTKVLEDGVITFI